MSLEDVDKLSELLDNISVDKTASLNSEQPRNPFTARMAPPVEISPRQPMNWELFKSKLNNIKPFNGDSNALNKFLIRCENLVQTYQAYGDPMINAHVLECIQEKLVDRAELMVGNRLEINSWVSLKEALIQCFSDRRDLDCLVQELTRSKPHKGEHLNDFGSRIQLLRSSVISRINSDRNLTADEKQVQANHYSKVALNTFIAGCSGTLKNNLHLKKPASLEDAIAYVVEFENFERMYGNLQDRNPPQSKFNTNASNFKQPFQNFQRNPNFQNNPFQNPNFNQFPRPQFGNFNNPLFQNEPFNNNPFYQNQPFQRNHFNFPQNQKFVWPSQPINVQPIPQPKKKFFTNSQVFGRPKNVFRPNQIPKNQLPTPEPMSTTSRNPSLQSRSPYNDNFQPNNRPHFVFEELHTNQYTDPGQEIDYESDSYDYCQDLHNQDSSEDYYSQNIHYSPNNSYHPLEEYQQNDPPVRDNIDNKEEQDPNFQEPGPSKTKK